MGPAEHPMVITGFPLPRRRQEGTHASRPVTGRRRVSPESEMRHRHEDPLDALLREEGDAAFSRRRTDARASPGCFLR